MLLVLSVVFMLQAVTFAAICPQGDLTGDCLVSFPDVVEFANQWLNLSECEGDLPCANFDGLNGIDYLDFSILANNWLEGMPLVINEFMASNSSDSGVSDPQGEFDDWIEIYNFGNEAIDLAGMYLTDDLTNPTKWRIPSGYSAQTTVAAGGFLVIWADEDTLDGPLHTTYKLSAGGEDIGLFDTDGSTAIDTLTFADQSTDIAYGRYPDAGDDWRYFPTPTLAAVNNGAYLGEVDDPEFSHTRGFYDVLFELTIACESSGASLYYTTDGTDPVVGEAAGPTAVPYTEALLVSGSTCVRAAAIKTGWMPSPIRTHSYIFGADDRIKSTPVISLVGDPGKSLYEPDGVMANPLLRGIESERPISMEILDSSTGDTTQIDCGIRVRGNVRERYERCDDWLSGTNNCRFSFNVYFRGDYGASKFEYPLFGFSSVEKYDSFAIRGGAQDQANRFLADEWTRRVHINMGAADVAGTFVHFYINGVFKCYMNPCGRQDKEFYQEWYNSDYGWDIIEPADIRDGDNVAWNEMLNYAKNNNLSDPVHYQYVCDRLDIVEFTDYVILQVYSGNWDWPDRNWVAARERSPEGKFRFGVWDAENIARNWGGVMEGDYSVDIFNNNFPSWWGPNTGLNLMSGPVPDLYRALKTNPGFIQLWADRMHKHFRNNGAMTKGNLTAAFNQCDADMGQIPSYWSWYDTGIRDGFIPVREDKFFENCQREGLIDNSLGYPIFNVNGSYQHGGAVAAADTITITQSTPTGTVYYTVDGADPAGSPGSSELIVLAESASKKVLVPAGPIACGAGSISVEYWTGISGTTVASLTGNGNYPNNPSSSGSLSSFEIPSGLGDNYGTRVRGYLVPSTTGSYRFWIASDDNSELWLSTNASPASASRIAYVNDWTNSREWTKYSSQRSAVISLTAGQSYYIEALQKEGTGGDNLAVAWEGPGIAQQVISGAYLIPLTGNCWTEVGFNDVAWTSGTGGVGFENNSGDPVNYASLIDTNVQSTMYNVNSTCYIRIPFTVSAGDLAGITNLTLKIRYDDGFIAYLNGVKVAEDYADSTPSWDSFASGQRDDSVCVTASSINISSYIGELTAGDNVLAIHGMNQTAGSSDFLITAELVSVRTDGGLPTPTAIEYTGGFNLSKSSNLKARILSTAGQWSVLNDAVYEIGSIKDKLRITELMYHPADPNTEYVELKNISASAINLNLVRFTRGITYTFGDVTLAAGQHILLVENLAAFEAKYETGLNVAGQYTGSLDNSGERIRLEDALGNAILDFEYKDGWRSITDGDGYSLTIINPANTDTLSWGYKDNWRASAYVGGSSGTDDSGLIPNPGAIVINEVLSHSHSAASDWIELYNTTSSPIDIGGWYLSDSDTNLMKYRFATGTTIAANGYLYVTEMSNFGYTATDSGRLTAFALSENGDEVFLTSKLDGNSHLTGYRSKEDFGASETGVSFGRYYKASTDSYNFVPMASNTLGAVNSAPLVGPIVISEIMYNPDWPAGGSYVNNEYEFIELYNPTDSAVTLYDSEVGLSWKFTCGIDYAFPTTPVVIPAQGKIVVAKNPTAFSWRFPSVPSNKIFGPYNGKLANEGEQLELGKPGDVDEFGVRQYIRVERINYSDGSHPGSDPVEPDLWPTAADGMGSSLGRINSTLYGNDPANWEAIAPTPGI
jgi:hypothetical protein